MLKVIDIITPRVSKSSIRIKMYSTKPLEEVIR
nr:MAG TPA: hypothetical protein [Crassvirales sp.]